MREPGTGSHYDLGLTCTTFLALFIEGDAKAVASPASTSPFFSFFFNVHWHGFTADIEGQWEHTQLHFSLAIEFDKTFYSHSFYLVLFQLNAKNGVSLSSVL